MEILRHRDLSRFAAIVQNGGVVVYPTDTVWGLGCNALDPVATQKLKHLKGKPTDGSLIWLLPSVDAVVQHCGPVTPVERRLLLKKHTSVVINGQAVRIVKSGWLNKILTACGVPLVATSANRHGQSTITSWRQGTRLFDGQIDAVIRGRRIKHHAPSTLLRVEPTQPPKIKVIRAGSGISIKQMDTLLRNYLTHLCGAENVQENEPLARWTTFRVGGPARYFVTVQDKATLQRLVSALEYLEYPYFVLGLGANVLASDRGYDGVVIKLNFKTITHNDIFLYADAGAKLGGVLNYARDHGLTGFEWATGIPATVGGGVYMNCGAFDHSMSDMVVLVDVLDHGQIKTLTREQIHYGYRHSVFMDEPAVIIGAYFRLNHGDPATIQQNMEEISAKRKNHPHEPSAGSVFKRPRDGFYVGREIQQLGLGGYTVGGAMVSPQHCNFIVNTGHATCDDVLAVMYHVQDAIEKATGVLLETEIIFLGRAE